ncbi:MAG TPA: CAP domain-containing protein [Xanthobacteraceae bacterium]|nr:CAP domain-containing protein [Xanthobacteraceae bacterium]
MSRLRTTILIAALAGALAACAGDPLPPEQPTFYRSLASPVAQLDAATAASMISGFRQNNGLGPVTLDPVLMQLAQTQASGMAARDKLDHDAKGEFAKRMRAAGFDPKVTVENVSAGYHTLAEAFSGWRDSPPHRANMLKDGVTRIGIAAVYTPNSKYKVYWALILGAPAGT